MRRIGLFMVLSLLSFTAMAQMDGLSKHQWEHRLLLLVGEQELPQMQQQIEILRLQEKGLEERRLLVYQVTANQYRYIVTQESKWKAGNSLYQSYAMPSKPFRVILIGLDGGIKKSQHQPISTNALFGLIDQMPMRRSELNRNE